MKLSSGLVAAAVLCTCTQAFSPGAIIGRGLRGSSARAQVPLRPALAARQLQRVPHLRLGRASILSLNAQAGGSEALVENVQMQIETGIMIGLPDATEDQVEELMAILTVSARSLMRKVSKNPGIDVGTSLLDSLEQKYVDEEGILTSQQWASVRAAVRLPKAASADPAEAVKSAAAAVDAKLDAYISSQRLPAEDGKEIKAISLALSRSVARRAANGKVSPGDVKGVFQQEVRARLDDEGLLPASSWDAMMEGSSQAAAAPTAPVTSRMASPSAKGDSEPGVKAAEFVSELERLFPDVKQQLLQDAARGQTELEDAVYNVISSTAKEEEKRTLDAIPRTVAGSGPAPDGMQVLGTPPVTTGACCFGLCVDVQAKGQPVTITAIKTASSPGLNWGKGGAIKMRVWVTEGGSRGKELDATKWSLVGQDMAITLPTVSWADATPQYGSIPLEQPIRIEAGCKAGFVIHTNDLYGLVMTVGSGSGGDVDFWRDDNADDPDKPTTYEPGSLVAADDYLAITAGYSLGSNVFEEFDNAMMPQPGGLAGVVEYTVG